MYLQEWVASKRSSLIWIMNLLTSPLWGFLLCNRKLSKFRFGWHQTGELDHLHLVNTQTQRYCNKHSYSLKQYFLWFDTPFPTVASARLEELWACIVSECLNLLVVCRVHYGWAMVKAANLRGCRGHPLRNALAPPTRHWVPDRCLLSQTKRDAKTLNCDFKVL